jgi:hypothetical protein
VAKRTLQDNLAKLDAQTKMVKGGKQYTPAVAAEVAGINRGKASMRNEKRPAPKTTSLSKLQKSCK